MSQLNKATNEAQQCVVLDQTKTKIIDNPGAGNELTMKQSNAIPSDVFEAFPAA
jgi:hypothetical protein